MGLSRETLERQIAEAKGNLEALEKSIAEKNQPPKKRNPKWRQLNARHRDLTRRLSAVEAIETREADAAARKAEKSSAE